MAVAASRIVVSSTYAELVAHPQDSSTSSGDQLTQRILLKNTTNSAAIYLGGPSTVSNQRFLWAPGDGPLSVDLEPSESLWAASSGADQTIHSIRNGR